MANIPSAGEISSVTTLTLWHDLLREPDPAQLDRVAAYMDVSDLDPEWASRLVAERGTPVIRFSPQPDDPVKWITDPNLGVLADNELRILAKYEGIVTERQLVQIYPGRQTEQWWQPLVESRVGKWAVTCMVGGRGDDVPARLTALKGRVTDDLDEGTMRSVVSGWRGVGLPSDYKRRARRGDIEAQKELTRQAKHDRMHVPDPDDEATIDATIAAFFSADALRDVAKEYPGLAERLGSISSRYLR